MYDADKAKELQKQSHVRGALSKQFFSGQQSQLQKKRREMKRILDEQVQQRRRVKQKQKQEIQKKQRKQQQQIKKYYEEVIERERRLSQNNSNVINQKNNSNDTNLYNQSESLVKKHVQQNLKQRAQSKAVIQNIQNGDMPLMPVMAMSDGQLSQNNNHYASNSTINRNSNKSYSNHYDSQNAGNIPLLDLSDESNFLRNKKKSKTQLKKQKTDRQNNYNPQGVANSNVKFIQSRNTYQQNQNPGIIAQLSASLESKRNQRRRTMSDEDNGGFNQQNIINSRMSKGSKFHENSLNKSPQESALHKSPSHTKRNTELQIPEQIQQMQSENKALKSQLKKSQEAISLLIGAVRSNPKLDKFRVQAQKILHTSQKQTKMVSQYQNKINEKRQQSPLLLPKLKVKHQSIMHDYLLQAARKGKMKHIKSQTSKY